MADQCGTPMTEHPRKKVLVVSYGSIGTRLVNVLTDFGHEVARVTRREVPNRFTTLAEAVQGMNPDYVVVANDTSNHYSTLWELGELSFTSSVLVEKPLFDQSQAASVAPELLEKTFVAYNLRHHPLLQKQKRALMGRSSFPRMCRWDNTSRTGGLNGITGKPTRTETRWTVA